MTPYCDSPFGYSRRKTRLVMVGKVGVGGDNPLRLQSMTTADTMDVEATFREALKLAQAGCEIVRITTPTVEDARRMGQAKEKLLKAGVDVPIVADIHFSPPAAMEAAEYADKVRINPGNFADSKRFAARTYTDSEYADELAKIEERFTPLALKLKRLKRALRIGTNHGSLSDRILNRYGDTPLGMVESALEYLALCEKNGFFDVIFSMKASNPKVMVEAYRLLAARLRETGRDYPFHLGVTEAGFGEDGRIKSAIGIGSLLADGIGDTLRVSLTENPEREIPVARELAKPFNERRSIPHPPSPTPSSYVSDFYSFKRRPSSVLRIGPYEIGGENLLRVAAEIVEPDELPKALRTAKARAQDSLPEIVMVRVRDESDLDKARALKPLSQAQGAPIALLGRFDSKIPAGMRPQDWDAIAVDAGTGAEISSALIEHAARARIPVLVEGESASHVLQFWKEKVRPLGLGATLGLAGGDEIRMVKEYRLLAAQAGDLPLCVSAFRAPVPAAGPAREEALLRSALAAGSVLVDGIGDMIWAGPFGFARELEIAYNILQGCQSRISKAEFVSCPSCGRTLFDLQSTTARIKARTGHLKGIKIAVMGCIVNGPGEMADADFGYVGGAPGKINLFVGKECVKKGIPQAEAEEALVSLIKAHNKWVEPSPTAAVS